MSSSRLRVRLLAAMLAMVLGGCSGVVDSPASRTPDPASVGRLDRADAEAAATAVKEHLQALTSGDMEAVLETVPDTQKQVFQDNPAQLRYWQDFKLDSVAPGSKWVGLAEVSRQYEELGYDKVAVFNVRGRLQERPNEVLSEDFDVIVVQDDSGHWLVADMGH